MDVSRAPDALIDALATFASLALVAVVLRAVLARGGRIVIPTRDRPPSLPRSDHGRARRTEREEERLVERRFPGELLLAASGFAAAVTLVLATRTAPGWGMTAILIPLLALPLLLPRRAPRSAATPSAARAVAPLVEGEERVFGPVERSSER